MENLTIKSRKTGETYDFSMSSAGGYVWLDNKYQICEGGDLRGDTVMATPEGFETACRRWYRAYTKTS